MASGFPGKRPSASLDYPHSKRPTRPYHRHHRLQDPVILPASEPAVQDDANIDHLMNRSIGQLLQHSGFHHAEPVALSSLRGATEEYLLRLSTYVRQSMLSSRRIQPIPQDFEYALKRCRLSTDDLRSCLESFPHPAPVPTLPPSPPPDDDALRKLPFLKSLSGEEERVNRPYIPKHFPSFPSKHTYSATAVFTERDSDPRKIRERAAEDGRHGEEALRKLASAAFRDNQTASAGRDKKLWGRRMESMESMFEKTAKGLAKKLQKDPLATGAPASTAMEIDSGPLAEMDTKGRSKVSLNLELGPIVNCERDLWRRATTMSDERAEKHSKPPASTEPIDRGMRT
ncbi:hypothetical protein NUU61_003433 [Penicillium alfredii]|uniref:Transcription initiation factor TFIID subunit 8 n=1 Tax=Penicillium alfredii TaxID=1506179 RepID=A0A9W9FTB8_9EURO|nr:uncharacterized protein NUU61_003433 [Penicillium alfredii]KAJ5106086.1 hypothetical protein NUU61_003433 [Penicillium alfredii]